LLKGEGLFTSTPMRLACLLEALTEAGALRFTIKNLRYALCAMLYALCWYVKGEGD